ncbi:MAG: hypothetical protein ACK5Q5_17180 [Planctomycetaceae bacterium]
MASKAMGLDHVTLLCFFASYLVALVLEISQLYRQSQGRRWIAMTFIAAGLVAHTAYLLNRSHNSHLPPLLSSAHDWLLVLSWLAVVLLLAVQAWNWHLGVGLFALPPVVLMVGASRFVSQDRAFETIDLYGLRMLHASLWVLGIAGVTVSFVLSLMFLAQHRRLKLKRALPGELRLFSLERLGRWNWWGVILCVPLLTLAMITGILLVFWSRAANQPVSFVQSGFLLTAIVWLGMAILFGWLIAARHPGGRSVAWRTMWACGLLLTLLLAQQVFSKGGIHGQGTRPEMKAAAGPQPGLEVRAS